MASEAGLGTRTAANALFLGVLCTSLIGSLALGFWITDFLLDTVFTEPGPLALISLAIGFFVPFIGVAGFWMAFVGGGSSE